MPAKEIKDLRHSGKLEEALDLAKSEFESDPENIWTKRNLSWVYYDFLKQNNSFDQFDTFKGYLIQIVDLNIPSDETMFYENLAWQIGKMGFELMKSDQMINQMFESLYSTIKDLSFRKPSESYSFIFKSFHRYYKNTDKYLDFADWWGFENFRESDFEKEKLDNGKEIMAIAEQGYITYAKKLLPVQTNMGLQPQIERERIDAFIPSLKKITSDYKELQYPPYFLAKLLLLLEDKEDLLEVLIPFARRKRNDFWVWELLGEAFHEDQEKQLACYCKALSSRSPEEMLVSLRQKMASLLITKEFFKEAKTEILLLVRAREIKNYRIPDQVNNWTQQEWYQDVSAFDTNMSFYRKYSEIAEDILFHDIQEEKVFVEFVNRDKKIVNFISTENRSGFFKYYKLLKDVKIGSVLSVRFKNKANDGISQVYTAKIIDDPEFKLLFIKDVKGEVKIPPGKSFGFVNDIYIHPKLIVKNSLSDGSVIEGEATKSFNPAKNVWGWKITKITNQK